MDLLLSWTWLAAVIWLIARAFQQRGLLQSPQPAEPPPADRAPKIAVIVPARDEAANIDRCLRSLVAQTYPASRLRIVVIDDHSGDRTFAIASALAQTYPQLTVLRSPPLPPHWVGKSHACWIGACAVAEGADWLCFVDADVWAEPALVASAIAAANAGALDLLSLAPRQELQSFAERLVMPCGLYLLAFCQDLRTVQARNSSEVTATGQFMLVRRACYETVGGHAAVRGAICEDLMLARLLKRSGGRAILQDGRRLLSTRMYRGWSTLWIGIAKNLSEMLGGPLRTIAIAVAAVALAWAAWLIPLSDALHCAQGSSPSCVGLIPAALGSAAAFGLHIAGASYFGVPPWYGVLFPLGYSAGALIAIDSVRRRLSGRVTWKGRTYP
ncbi:MAG TPA: glycosyltransferase family A protein [Xanthobacteraceae bacterium]|nr:glycosyltransferase family A protein [Xanthobacteraceae bacterium]